MHVDTSKNRNGTQYVRTTHQKVRSNDLLTVASLVTRDSWRGSVCSVSLRWGRSAKMSIYSGFLYAKFFDCGVSHTEGPFAPW